VFRMRKIVVLSLLFVSLLFIISCTPDVVDDISVGEGELAADTPLEELEFEDFEEEVDTDEPQGEDTGALVGHAGAVETKSYTFHSPNEVRKLNNGQNPRRVADCQPSQCATSSGGCNGQVTYGNGWACLTYYYYDEVIDDYEKVVAWNDCRKSQLGAYMSRSGHSGLQYYQCREDGTWHQMSRPDIGRSGPYLTWNFNDGVTDLSGNERHGVGDRTIEDGIAKLGGNTRDYIIIPNLTGLPDQVTFELWMKSTADRESAGLISIARDVPDGGGRFKVGDSGRNSYANTFLAYYHGSSGTLQLTSHGTFKSGKFPARDLFDGEWHHIAFTREWSNGHTVAYKDGEKWFDVKAQAAGHTFKKRGLTLVLGQDQDRTGGGFSAKQAFNGEIDYFSIYGDVKTQDEIKDSIRQTRPGIPSFVAVSEQGNSLKFDSNTQEWSITEVEEDESLYSISLKAGIAWALGLTEQTLFMSRDNGATWGPTQRLPGAIDQVYKSVDATDNNVWLIANDELHVTNNGGQSWQSKALNIELSRDTTLEVTKIHAFDDEHALLIGGIKGVRDVGVVYETRDGGDSWEMLVGDDFEYFDTTDQIIRDISITDEGNWYVVGDENLLGVKNQDGEWNEMLRDPDYYQLIQNELNINPYGSFEAVHFIDNTQGWIASQQKIIHVTEPNGKWDPNKLDVQWTNQQNVEFQDHHDIVDFQFTDDMVGCAVGSIRQGGNKGIVLCTVDGGESWKTVYQDDGRLGPISSIATFS
jgi:photosystem II stability/assembly factor-like uncharacterized protein